MYTGEITVARDQLPKLLKTAVAIKIHGIYNEGFYYTLLHLNKLHPK